MYHKDKQDMKRHQITAIGYTLTTVLALALAACTDMELDTGERPIQLSAGQAFDVTRAATDIQGPAFQAGEEVSVFITGKSTEVAETQLAGYPTICTTSAPTGNVNRLIPVGEQPYYPYGDESQAHIFAVYPKSVAATSSTIQDKFTVAYDQTDNADYKASDLMMVVPFDHVKNAETVNLPFDHKMAKLIITAIGDPGILMDATITVGGVYRSIDIDVPNGSFKTLRDNTTSDHLHDDLGDRGSITMTNGGAVLIPPQVVTTSDEVGNFITVTGRLEASPSETKTAKFNILKKHFKPGKVYRLILAIAKENFSKTEAITGWSEDYGELMLTPSGGYQGISIDDIDGSVKAADGGDADGYYVYNGQERCPEPDVWYGDETKKKLNYGTDYIYQYVDNKNAGTGQVLVLGQNYYAGLAATRGFTIRKAQGRISFANGSDKTGLYFNLNEVIEPATLINTGDGVVTYTAADAASAKVVAVDPVTGQLIKQNVGTATIKATAADGTNFYYTDGDGQSDTYTVQIVPKPEASGDLTVTYETGNTTVSADMGTTALGQYFVYNGEARELASLSVYDRVADVTLVNNVDYTYTLTNNTNAGDAVLNIKGKPGGNYATVDININVPIAKATPTITVETTDITMGIHSAFAPMNRRKTRVATTEQWAAANLRYSVNASSKVQENDYISISDRGVITGKKPGTTTVYVDVTADASNNENWYAAIQQRYSVTVVSSDFDFTLNRNAQGKVVYNSPTNLPTGTTDSETQTVTYSGCISKWTCPADGLWQLEVWGAQGGSTPTTWKNAAGTVFNPTNRGMGGRGAHIGGRIRLKKGQELYVTVGEQGRNITAGETRTVTDVPAGKYEPCGYAWNGGGCAIWGGYHFSKTNTSEAQVVVDPISGGGGASDMSLDYGTYGGGNNIILQGRGSSARSALTVPVDSLAWKSPQHLFSRIIVAGGGGGGFYYANEYGYGDGGNGGAMVGANGVNQDKGEGGQLNRPGWGGFGGGTNYEVSPSNSYTNTPTMAKIYDDGPRKGGMNGWDGMFGEGGYYTHMSEGSGCGGGGWYGGGAAGQSGPNGSGGGGSSFIWTATYASYYPDTYITSSSISSTNVVENPPNYSSYKPTTTKIPYFESVTSQNAGANAGDGKAKITAIEIY